MRTHEQGLAVIVWFLLKCGVVNGFQQILIYDTALNSGNAQRSECREVRVEWDSRPHGGVLVRRESSSSLCLGDKSAICERTITLAVARN